MTQHGANTTSKKLLHILESDGLKILLGCFAMFVAMQEEGEVIGQALEGDFGAHHGVLVLGLSHALHGLLGVFEAIEKWLGVGKG